MRIVLDLDKLVDDGRLTPQQAEELKAMAARDTGALAINILLAFGCVAVAAGAVALNPSWGAAIGLGALLTIIGAGIVLLQAERWQILGTANLIVGTLATAGGLIGFTDGGPEGYGAAVVLLAGIGIFARSGFLIALSPLALAFTLGSSAGYGHATYMLVVREATIVIVVFLLLAWLAYLVAGRCPRPYERLARIFARMSLVLANFGFWIGSLWGDEPGASWATPPSDFAFWEEWREGAVHIPDLAFVVAWAALIVGTGIWAARANLRFVLGAAAVFGGIHFYTQWFERIGHEPASLIVAGLVGIAAAIVLWRLTAAAKVPARPA
jgi:iron complex transport system permease protein